MYILIIITDVNFVIMVTDIITYKGETRMVTEEKYVRISSQILRDIRSGRKFRPTGYVRVSNSEEINRDLPFILNKMKKEKLITFDYDELGKIKWSTIRI